MTLPKVRAIVVNHKRLDHVVHCLGALDAVDYPYLRTIVVDNDSGPEEVATLREAGLRVVEAGGNLGYAGGNNVGVKLALDEGADLLWILNPDTEPHPQSLRVLVGVLADHADVGIIGGRILEDDAAGLRIQSEGGRIVWDSGGRSELINRSRRPTRRKRQLTHVDFVPGAAMLVRREVFEQIGLLPEEYFMYFEETEFCVRAVRAGFRTAIHPKAEFIHRTPRTIGMPGEAFVYYFIRNRLLFGRRHTEVPFEELVADVVPFIQGWRRRVEELDPEWGFRFEELVSWATEDARSGVNGHREDVG